MLYKLDIKDKNKTIRWLRHIEKGTADASPLWRAMIPKITEFVNFEFDTTRDKHKLWQVLNEDYLKWKIKHGKARGIGIMDGKLRDGAGRLAQRKIKPKSMTWILNQANVESEEGYPYAPVFNFGKRDGSQPPRPIYKYTVLRINSFLKLDAKKFSTGQHANFTYRWLKNSLKAEVR